MPAFCFPPVIAVPTASARGCLPLVPGRGPPRVAELAEETALGATSRKVLSRSNLSDMAGNCQIVI